MATPNPVTTEWVPLWSTTGGTVGGGGPHHATHEPGGGDELVALSASILTSGSLPYARVPVSAASLLLGRGSSGAGAMQELTLGTNLSISGTTLNAAASAPGLHHTTHEPGGGDALVALSASILTSGTLPDAQLSANVAMRNAANTLTGELDLTGGSGTGYSTAPLEIRTTANPRISFHWPGVVASQLGMDSAGTIRTFDNPGTGYAAFAASSLYASSTGNSVGDLTCRGGTNFQNGLYVSAGSASIAGNVQSGLYMYPGAVTNPYVIQGSWYLASHSSYGLYSNTGLYLESNLWANEGIFRSTLSVTGTVAVIGGVQASGNVTCDGYMMASGVIFPGRIDPPGTANSSYYLAAHSSYGLYVNSGLYLTGSLRTEANVNAVNVYASGGYYERGRGTRLGEWWTIPYSAANFSASPGTWTVESSDVVVNYYTVIGMTMIWYFYLNTTSVNGASSNLYINIPGGFAGGIVGNTPVWALDAGTMQNFVFAYSPVINGTYISIFNPSKSWSNSANATSIRACLILSLV